MSFSEICNALESLYHEALAETSGANADYIPELAMVNPDLFAVSACSVTGETWSIGDDDISFTFQSTIKPLLYDVALGLTGTEEVHGHIGYEPSGQRFNAFVMDEDGKPHNPLINAGAIMSSAIIRSKYAAQVDAFKAVKTFAERAVGYASPIGYDNSVFLSELNTAARNFALCYFMRENSALLKQLSVERVLELYFSSCALTVNSQGLAAIAATYACGGVCPLTRDEVMEPSHARQAMQIMYNCGMYDYSGRFSFEVGIPAKSGVSGALYLCVPGRFGLGIWSPRLDRFGNTVRGLIIAKQLVKRFPELHIFGQAMRRSSRTVMSRFPVVSTQILIHAAASGNADKVKELIEKHFMDVNTSDYDERTALHLAVAEGHKDVVAYLVQAGANCDARDRFGNTPRAEAKKKKLSGLMPKLQS